MLLAALAGCAPDAVVSSTEPVTGPGTVYALASANEVTVPVTFTQEGRAVTVQKGALTLGTDSTFIFSLAIRTSINGSQPTSGTTTYRGQLRRTGTALQLMQQSDTLFAGVYSPNTVTLLVAKAQVTGERFVFAR